MEGVWADGVDASTTTGLCSLAAKAGLNKAFVDDAIEDGSWRAIAEVNRRELFAMGLWGVPSFRVNDGLGLWGQDRLWLVQEELSRL